VIGYLDCFSGISGNMLLGALVNAGLEVDRLKAELDKLALPRWRLETGSVRRSGIEATLAEVVAERDQPHRKLGDIEGMITAADLPAPVKERSVAVFRRLAEAEGKIHQVPPEQVGFHEVGAVDSIVDVVGSVTGLALLGIDSLYVSPLPLGHGFVQAEHGRLPVPAPATVELLRGVPAYGVDVEAELVTPTGAALAAVLAHGFGPIPAMSVAAVGYGAGSREFPSPNLLRLLVGESTPGAPGERDRVVVIETNIDDMNPEFYSEAIERLFEAGALDAFFAPATMKRGRPATVVTVLARPESVGAVTDALFRETTTFGVRMFEVDRRCLARESVEVETDYGRVRVKIGRRGEELVTAAPEFADCQARARERGVAVRVVYEAAKLTANRVLS
jgi:uncharacterized protein (TIGR00299 family) protein